jgi:hypothetical protein
MENNELQEIDHQKEQHARHIDESVDLLVPEGWDHKKIKREFINKQVEKKIANTTSNNEINIRQSVDKSVEHPVQEPSEETITNEIVESTVVSIESKFSPIFMTNTIYEDHPFAEIFPEATESEFNNLLVDMNIHGQFEPIIIFEGKIADGRTRKRVQDTLKRSTLAHEWIGEPDELLNYLYAKSQHRQLSCQQRAVIALQFVDAERELAKQRQGMRTDLSNIVNEVKAKEKEKKKGRALDQVAKKMGTNRTYISQAEYVQDKAKELLDYVKRNELSLSNAKLLAQKLVKPEDRQIAIQQYKNGEGKMQSIIDDILYEQNPTRGVSKGEKKSKPNSSISRKIVFSMKISESVLEEIKDVLYKHGYTEEPYQILVATNEKEATEWIEPLLQGEAVSTITYEIMPEDKIETIDLKK